jgi:hypothetical protein
MTMPFSLDTRKLLRRSSLSREAVALLAWLEGATHQLVLTEARVTFYRHAGGAVQVATATYETDGWSLSGWALRSVPQLPSQARELRRPAPLANYATI